MPANYLNRYGVVCGTGTDHRMLPEAELWTRVILQAIDDLHGRRSSTSGSAQHSARQWFASASDAVGSFIWTCHVIDVDPNYIRSRLAKKHWMNNQDEAVITSRRQGVKNSTEAVQIFALDSRLRPSRLKGFKRVEGGEKERIPKEKVSSYEMSQLAAFNVGKSPLSPGIAVKVSK